jgi:large conductance mechanosensitive channel
MIAVGFILASYFILIVESVIDNVFTPIIAAIFGKSSIGDIGFDIGDSRIRIGVVIDAAISFVIVAFILFLLIKAYNKWKGTGDDDDAGPSEIELLTEIRDSLRNR